MILYHTVPMLMETKDTDVYTSIQLIYSNYPKELVYSEK